MTTQPVIPDEGRQPNESRSTPAIAMSTRAINGRGAIEYLEISHFRKVSTAVHVPIRPVTLIVGSTASGKSCVRDALRFVDTVLHGSNSSLLDYSNRWAHRSSESRPRPIHVEVGLGPTNLAEAQGRAEQLQDRLPERLMFVEDERNPLWLESDLRQRVALTVEADASGLSSLLITACGQLLVQVERVDPEGWFLLMVNPDAFGASLWDLASEEYGMPAETEHEFVCEVTWRHEPLGLDLPYRSKHSDFHGTLVDLANYLIGQVALLIEAPAFVDSDCDGPVNMVPAVMTSTSASVVTQEDQPDARPEWRVDMSEVRLGQPTLMSTDNPGGPTRLDFPSALSQLAKSWLKTEVRARAENQLRRVGLEVPIAAEDVKPWRNPFHATPSGERDDYARGREPHAPLVEALHAYVDRQLWERLFPDQRLRVEYNLIEVTRPDLRSTRTGRPVQATGCRGDHAQIRGLVQTAFTDNTGATLDPRDLAAGIRAALPALVGLHTGFFYLEHPARHLDAAKQLALAEIVLDRVKASPVTLVLETAEPRIVKHLLKALIRSPRDSGKSLSAPSLYCDQIAVTTFFTRRDGTSSASWTTFDEPTDFLDEKTDDVLSTLEWHTQRNTSD